MQENLAKRVKLREQKTDYKDLSDMPPLEDDEEEAILLAQIEAAINSYKLKNETRQILHLLYEHNKITQKVYNNLMKSLWKWKKILL